MWGLANSDLNQTENESDNFANVNMSAMKESQFKLQMNLMIQNLLLTSLGMCKFVMMHDKHPLAIAIKQFKLIETSELDHLIETVKNTTTGQTVLLSLADEILIYTALDITCKAYLTELGDENFISK